VRPHCGHVPTARHSGKDPIRMQTLYRPRDDRMIAGVCSGIARRFGIEPTLVRILFVASLFLPGPQILIYLAAWLLMPNESSTLA
jgi:phage shock protein C